MTIRKTRRNMALHTGRNPHRNNILVLMKACQRYVLNQLRNLCFLYSVNQTKDTRYVGKSLMVILYSVFVV